MKKVGISFSGGGVRGALQVGALLAMEEAGVLDNVIAYAGTSIGSLNAVMANSYSPKEIRSIWLNEIASGVVYSENRFMEASRKLFNSIRFNRSNFYKSIEDYIEQMGNSIFDINKIREYLDANVKFPLNEKSTVYIALTELVKSPVRSIPTRISVTFKDFIELIPFKKGLDAIFGRQTIQAIQKEFIKKRSEIGTYIIANEKTKDQLLDLLLASSAIPLVFPPVEIKGKTYIDGGFFDNLPDDALIDKVDYLISIDVMYSPLSKFFTQSKANHLLIAFTPWNINILAFNEKNIKKLINKGYYQTKRILKQKKVKRLIAM
jgi:predicted acylesterase/phospholipase RssA